MTERCSAVSLRQDTVSIRLNNNTVNSFQNEINKKICFQKIKKRVRVFVFCFDCQFFQSKNVIT